MNAQVLTVSEFKNRVQTPLLYILQWDYFLYFQAIKAAREII